MKPADRLFFQLQALAMDGKPCPKNETLNTVPAHFKALVKTGRIAIDPPDAKIYRVVKILVGPHAGKATAMPEGAMT